MLGHQVWKEPQNFLVRIILNKTGMCKVGKVVVVPDVDYIQLHAYVGRSCGRYQKAS